MGQIQLGGLATGLDTSGLIQKLLAVDQQPITLMQTQEATYKAVDVALQDLNGKLATLKSSADALNDPETFFARSVTSSDDTVATATASAGATQGTFTVTTSSLARGSIATSSGTTGSLTNAIANGTGTLQFRLGTGPVVTVNVTASTTIADLAQGINNAGAGVRAMVVNVGTPTAPAYELTLTSNNTGSANTISIVHADTTIGMSTATIQAAADAKFTITGLGTFTRSTNTVSDAIDGVTITLKAPSGSTDLTIAYDSSATQSKVQTLLDAYNTIVTTIDSQTKATIAADGTVTPSAFTGDATTRMIEQALANIVSTSVGGAYGSLANLGITTQRDGTLTMDTTQFQNALASDPASVRALFTGTGTAKGIAGLLSDRADSDSQDVTGTIAVERDGLSQTIQNLQQQIDDAQSRLNQTQQMLQEKFANMESVVSQLQSTGNALLSALGQVPSYKSSSSSSGSSQ